MVRSRGIRILLIGMGFLFLAIGFVGAFLPIIPTTGPILLAAFLFSQSSERFDRWLSQHRIFGPIVQDWRARRGFTVRMKVTAIVAIAVTFTITLIFAISNSVVQVLLIGLATCLIIYILRLPTKPAEPPA